MGKLSLEDMLEHAEHQQAALAWHLQSNHYPPVHLSFIETAEEAIRLANAGEWNTPIKMPNGLTKTVEDIIEGLHLGDFLDQEK